MSSRKGSVVGVCLAGLIATALPSAVKAAQPASNEKIERTLVRLLDEAVERAQARDADSAEEESIRSMKKLEKELVKGLEAKPEAAKSLCAWTPISLCLQGRFVVAGVYENPYSAPGVLNVMGAIQITPEAGYMWFFTPANMEVPIKIVNFCPTGRYGVFAAGLSDFGVSLAIQDMVTGLQVIYINDPKHIFNTIIDQNTPWPCF